MVRERDPEADVGDPNYQRAVSHSGVQITDFMSADDDPTVDFFADRYTQAVGALLFVILALSTSAIAISSLAASETMTPCSRRRWPPNGIGCDERGAQLPMFRFFAATLNPDRVSTAGYEGPHQTNAGDFRRYAKAIRRTPISSTAAHIYP
jgi:hypothetical protein